MLSPVVVNAVTVFRSSAVPTQHISLGSAPADVSLVYKASIFFAVWLSSLTNLLHSPHSGWTGQLGVGGGERKKRARVADTDISVAMTTGDNLGESGLLYIVVVMDPVGLDRLITVAQAVGLTGGLLLPMCL